jgi:hypothetical protein
MGGIALLNQARAAGLRLAWDGELLRIKGARKNTALAKELLDRKREVIAALTADGEPALLVTTDRIRACRQRYYPVPEQSSVPDAGCLSQADENIEMHGSALFDVVVEVDFYDGRRIRIPQQSTPAGWTSPF